MLALDVYPVLEGLFGTILESWPTIEPMLMDFVGMLSDGLGEAIPVVMELGQTLLPVLTNVLGTLFQAATPLISAFFQFGPDHPSASGKHCWSDCRDCHAAPGGYSEHVDHQYHRAPYGPAPEYC